MSQSQTNYKALLDKVDDKFTEIQGRNADKMQCRQGCHSCCKPGLTVSLVEADAISAHLKAHPELNAALQQQERDDPHSGTRCAFLSKDGACGIYKVRPIICRSHGVPIAFKDGKKGVRRDVCPLNFTEKPVETIDQADVVNIEIVNTILALINAQLDSKRGQERTALLPSVLGAR